MNYYLVGAITIILISVITFLMMIFAPNSKTFIDETIFSQDLDDLKIHKNILVDDLNSVTEWKPHLFSKNINIAPLKSNTKDLVSQIPEFKCGYFFKIDQDTHTYKIPGNKECNNTLRAVFGLKVSNERLCSVWVNDEARHFKNKWIIFDPSKDNAFINDSFAALYGISLDFDRPKNIPMGSSEKNIQFYNYV